jgi:predicted Zn-dependent protease
MTPHAALIRSVTGRALPGELIEVLARVTAMHVAVATAGRLVSRQVVEHVGVHVRVFADGAHGAAGTERLDEAGLCAAVADARDALRVGRLAAPPPAPLMGDACTPDPTSTALCGPGADLAALVPLVCSLGGPGLHATVGRTERTVVRGLAGEDVVSYRSLEVQAHVRDLDPAARGAQSARVGGRVDAIDRAGLLDDLAAARERLILPPVAYEGSDWTAVEPAAAARLLAWVVPALTTAWRNGAGRGATVGRPGLTIVDEQGLEHPNGHAFDDFGFPGRTVTLVQDGRLVTPLLASDDPASSTSSASRGEHLVAAPSLVRLRPFGATTLPTRGTGVVVDAFSVLGGNRGADAATAQLSLGGVLVREGTAAGRVRMGLASTVTSVLERVVAVHGPARVHRFRGLHEGTWVHLIPFEPPPARQEQ